MKVDKIEKNRLKVLTTVKEQSRSQEWYKYKEINIYTNKKWQILIIIKNKLIDKAHKALNRTDRTHWK